jgi:hypothetical protein
MQYPTGFSRHVLWGAVLLVCVALAVLYKGTGLALDWGIFSAVVYWHVLAMHKNEDPEE